MSPDPKDSIWDKPDGNWDMDYDSGYFNEDVMEDDGESEDEF